MMKNMILLEEYRGIFTLVPLAKLSKEERTLVVRCLDGEDNFTEAEMSTLKDVAIRYKSAKDIDSSVLDNVDAVVKTIKTEADLIRLLEAEENHPTLTVNLPVHGEQYKIEFEVLPLTDSSSLQQLEAHANLFSDFSIRDRNVFQRGERGDELSPEEQDIYAELLRKINEKTFTESESMINSLLMNQLSIHGIPQEQTQRLWEHVGINVKTAIFMKVQDLLGLGDVNTRELFPVD